MKELELLEKEENKKYNTIRFVNAAQEIIDEEGLKGASIRKISQRAGFHNSTIYLYFKDLDQLIMLASMKYFREYSHSLELQSQKQLSTVENFLSIWNLFIDAILTNPHIFYNFFFGKRSDNLKEIMNLYYQIFPEERDQFSEDIESMYFGSNINERCLNLLHPLIKEKNLVTDKNVSMLNEITVSYCKYKLMQKCQDPSLDSQQIKKDILAAISHVTGI
ncbi:MULTISPECIES: TetR/AcrR family transcriptional regulator [unclassified Sedimentibacter]|uniref:TetR/AcrR family transcriptional regulator n=1 Tax=unclassified Sedimentibacter TaxID=2649220 RepID=UPI0027DEF6B8|nr:TetR/AcrR family transcriptional regulator [Sedimentibacter sp. MB35-C1]WMJ77590.1 TetR/AcrR family transcriptional regulator [Sedimentibacter sp. MB35-C1]